jgi:putative addiction module component (TIGR02574 family)
VLVDASRATHLALRPVHARVLRATGAGQLRRGMVSLDDRGCGGGCEHYVHQPRRARRCKPRYTGEVVSAAAKEILEATLKLDAKERARIAHEIIVSLDEEPVEEGVEQAWEQELARRADEIDSGAVKLEPWSKVRQELDGIVRGS